VFAAHPTTKESQGLSHPLHAFAPSIETFEVFPLNYTLPHTQEDHICLLPLPPHAGPPRHAAAHAPDLPSAGGRGPSAGGSAAARGEVLESAGGGTQGAATLH
jgi:hypothetical protein